MFQFCRTSEIQNNKKQSMIRYQLLTFFNEKLGRIQVQEFLMSYTQKKVYNEKEYKEDPAIKARLIGQKQIFFSNQFIQKTDYSTLIKSQVVPFYTKENEIKGCQLYVLINRKNEYCVLSLVDSDIYTYESDVLILGQRRFELNTKMLDHDHEVQFEENSLEYRQHKQQEYAVVVSAMLRSDLIHKNIFHNDESYFILRNATDKLMCMRLPNFQFIIMNNFDSLKKHYFFQAQEILQGQSICDISLNDPKSINQAIQRWEKVNKDPSGSIIDLISKGNLLRKEKL